MFWGARFLLDFYYYYASLIRRFLHPEIPRWRMDSGSSYYFATENDIKVISAVAAMFYRARRQYSTSENSNRYKPEVETLPKTGSSHVTLFSEVGRSRAWNSQNIALALEIASISVSVSELLLLPVCALWCLPNAYSVDTHGSGLCVPENIAAAAEITLISFSITKL